MDKNGMMTLLSEFPELRKDQRRFEQFIEAVRYTFDFGQVPINAEHAQTITYDDDVLRRFFVICLQYGIKFSYKPINKDERLSREVQDSKG